jgi:hypothetical protein
MTMLPNDPGMDVVMATYRAMRLAPPNVRLNEIGAVCPIDDTVVPDEHDASDDEAARLRRLDRRCALAIGLATVCGCGYAAGQLARPWTHLLPDSVLLTIASTLITVSVAGVGVVAVRRLVDWWPYRHNRVLGTAAEMTRRSDGGAR